MMRYHYTFIRMIKIKNIGKAKCWWGDRTAGLFILCRWKYKKWYSYFGKQFSSFLIELNIHLLYDPAVLVLGICPREMKTCVHTNTCAQMFIAAPFIIVKYWKPLKYPTSEWINKLIPPCRGILHKKKKETYNLDEFLSLYTE